MRSLISSLLFVSVLVLWQGEFATLAEKGVADREQTNDNRAITIKAEKRGFPNVNLSNGKDLITPTEQLKTEQPVNVVSADFDSDGIADLITAEVNGKLRFYRGKNLISGNAESKRLGELEPFELTEKVFSLDISPDSLAAGDFNADGQQDILAAAKDSNALVLLAGSGHATFSQPLWISVGGNITAFATGEIGRRDGQTDVAIAVTNEKGAFLFVYEHPESAFKHKPEVFKLPAPATEIAIGNLDEDFYADIAVACGNELTIVYGRGQAYPWDLLPASGIKRPAAFVATRKMPFAISAMTVGRFGNKRGETLAILGGDGSIYQLEPNRAERPSNNKLPLQARALANRNLFLPAGADVRNLATISDPQLSQQEAEKNRGLFVDAAEMKRGGLADFFQKRQEETAEKFKKADKAALAKMVAEGLPKAAEDRERAKQGYLRSISGKPSTLAKWQLNTHVAGPRFASAASGGSGKKLLRANISNSNLDDLLVIDHTTNKLDIVTQGRPTDQQPGAQVVELESEGSPLTVLPLRLNLDARSDLVVVRQGSPVPSVVMSAPASTFIVTSSDETGTCLGTEPCSLRNAMILANQTPGADEIRFDFGGATQTTIVLTTPLPVITEAVTISADVLVVGNGSQPTVEITGANINDFDADGLKIRTSNTLIFGLAVNQFRSLQDDNGSQVGGNGITIESTTVGSPNNGNNIIWACFLGTDLTGSLDKGNDATGLNIFDSDNNIIGGTDPILRNVISGNGSQEKPGVGISVTAGNNNQFYGNIIGLNSLGTGRLGNSQGVLLTGADNQFGGDADGAGNTVSANGELVTVNPHPGECHGVGMQIPILFDPDTFELLTLNNNLQGNRIGTNPAGTQAFGNCWTGIRTESLVQTHIGSITQNGRNIVSDSGLDAIWCNSPGTPVDQFEGGFCAIEGNNIGTDITGTIEMPNDWRNQRDGLVPITTSVFILNNLTYSFFGAPGGTTPGGACSGFCNLFSGNAGFSLGGTSSTGSILRLGYGSVGFFNNAIGTNQNGTQALPNTVGIEAGTEGDTFIGAATETLSLGNLISGNELGGVRCDVGSFLGVGGPGNCFVEANLVGTDVSGTFAVPNDNGGVIASAGPGGNAVIGGPNYYQRNVISGNDWGVVVSNRGGTMKVINNLIGLNKSLGPLGNYKDGIHVGGDGSQIGGTGPGEANQIAYNSSLGNNYAGVTISGGNGNTVRGNSIHDNYALGIDLTPINDAHGVTANDCQDPDVGGNDLQNFPLLDAPVFNADGTVTLTGALLSTPSQTGYTIDFYASPNADATNHGEGAIYLGSIQVDTEDHGLAPIEFTSSTPISPSNFFSATATDRFGSTSEFSCVAGATCSENAATQNKRSYQALAAVCFAGIIIVTVDTDESDPPASLNANICDVFPDPDHPGNQCTLRAAMELAEHRKAQFDVIDFAIPGAGVHTITPTERLPVITDEVMIDASSQPGYNGSPLIELSGAMSHGGEAHTGSLAFSLEANNSTIRGFAINRFNNGVSMGGSNNHIEACYLGLNPDGVSVPPYDSNPFHQSEQGIGFGEGSNNTIGGDQDSDGNIISGNTGVGIGFGNASESRISHNKIGTDKNGMVAIPNGTGITENSHGNLGDESRLQNEIDHNLISGNLGDESSSFLGYGIHSLNSSIPLLVHDNIIGANANLSAALPNSSGGILVGGDFAGSNTKPVTIRGNVIVGQNGTYNGFRSEGIALLGKIDYSVTDNYIGVTPAGLKIPNAYGIQVRGVAGTIGPGNVISGNSLSAIQIHGDPGFPVTNVKITGNFIGVNSANDANLGNAENGILFEGPIQGAEISGNTISGNGQAGILLPAESDSTKIHDNQIGKGADNGNPAIPNSIGLNIQSTGNQVYNNTLAGNTLAGIEVFQSSNNHIHDNSICDSSGIGILLGNVVPDFSSAANLSQKNLSRNSAQAASINVEANEVYSNRIERNRVGIALTEGANNNYIGSKISLALGLGNTIDGNIDGVGYGIFIGVPDFAPNDPDSRLPTGNKIVGNHIGEDSSGVPAPNKAGLVIQQAQNNFIGGVIPSTGLPIRNFIVASQETGITLAGDHTKGNQISFNKIGLSDSSPADSAFGNGGEGINLLGTGRNDIRFNIIGWNHGNGIQLTGISAPPGETVSCVISGNQIGVLQGNDSASAIGNSLAGIRLNNVTALVIGVEGNSSSESRNIIAANGADGIYQESSSQNRINNTIIGTSEFGSPAIGNSANGIHIVGGAANTLGGVQSVGNVIAGNQGNGILLEGSTINKLYGNRVGVVSSAGGNVKLANGLNGVKVLNSANTAIGDGTLTGYRNFIGGNNGVGVVLQGALTQTTSIKSNFIGTDQANANLGNELHGVFLTDQAAKNLIGGKDDLEAGNKIAFNGGDGVFADATAGCCNTVDPNSIYGNAGLGIDLGASGLTPNDPGDADSGPNNLQNYPEFISAAIIPGGSLVIQYKIDSAPANSNYGTDGLYVEFFKADSSLQGQTFIGSANYTTTNYTAGLPGPAVLVINNASSLGIQGGDKLVATATDADGNTSEFTSVNVGVVSAAPTAATAVIDGRILTDKGEAVAGVTINLSGTQSRKTITDSNGYYRFTGVETLGFYSLTPSLANFNFTPANRTFSALGNRTEAVFTADADTTAFVNPLNTPEFFVRQHYLDFLGREPDESGFNFWSDQILDCGTDLDCIERKRINVSAAYFLSVEFQQTGGLVDGLYRASYNGRPQFADFMPDTRAVARDVVVGIDGWQVRLEANRRAFVEAFVQRPAFVSAYGNLSNNEMVDTLIGHTGVSFTATEREALVSGLNNHTSSRADVLRRIAENDSFVKAKFNEAFVMMQYFGYLRRDPDELGYNFWLEKLNRFNGNYEQAEMVKAFIVSAEYQGRF